MMRLFLIFILILPSVNLKKERIRHLFSDFQICKNMSIYRLSIFFQCCDFSNVDFRNCLIKTVQDLQFLLIVDAFLVVECSLTRMYIKEEIRFMFFNGLIETNCEGLIDGSVTGVDFLIGFSIVEIKLSGEISVQINSILVFTFALTWLSPGLISHSIGSIKNCKFDLIRDLRIIGKVLQPIQTNVCCYKLPCMNVANNHRWISGLPRVNDEIRIWRLIKTFFLSSFNGYFMVDFILGQNVSFILDRSIVWVNICHFI